MASKSSPILDAARAAARNSDSAPATPALTAAGEGDLPAQKAIDTQSLAAAIPENSNKALECGETNSADAPIGLHAPAPSTLPTASPLSEASQSAKTGTSVAEGVDRTVETLDWVRDDSSGQVLTTNLADAAGADDAIAGFIEALGQPRDFGREANPPMATAGSGA
jgi:catalase